MTMNSSGTATSYPMASLYVGDLHLDVTEAMLYEKFSAAGPVLSIRVCRDEITSSGYAYVTFQDKADASFALQRMENEPIKGRPIHMLWTHDQSFISSGIGCNIFIKNLEKSIDNKALYDTFSGFGNILSCKVSCNENGSKGYGFVHFETKEAGSRAIEKGNGMLMKNKKLFVEKFQSRSQREKKLEEPVTQFTNIYINNFSDKLDEYDLEHMFEDYGDVKSVVVMRDEDGESRGFGFVNMETHEDAEAACEALNGIQVEGTNDTLYVGRAQKKQEREQELRGQYEAQKQERIQRFQGVNLYVKNLDDNVTDDELREAFSTYGTITSAKIMSDGERSRGFGFVCFSSPEEATKAVKEMNGRIVGTRALYVALAQRREDRQAHLRAQLSHKLKFRKGVQKATMAGDMRTVGPRAPAAPAIRPIIWVIHPQHQMMHQQAMPQPAFKYNQSVRNPTMAGYPQSGQPQSQQETDPAMQQAVHVQGQETSLQQPSCSNSQSKRDTLCVKKRGNQRFQRVFVTNLDDDMTDDDLCEAFSTYVTITSVKIMSDGENSHGFVRFSSPEEATKAVKEMNGRIVGTKPLYVALAQRREDRKTD